MATLMSLLLFLLLIFLLVVFTCLISYPFVRALIQQYKLNRLADICRYDDLICCKRDFLRSLSAEEVRRFQADFIGGIRTQASPPGAAFIGSPGLPG